MVAAAGQGRTVPYTAAQRTARQTDRGGILARYAARRMVSVIDAVVGAAVFGVAGTITVALIGVGVAQSGATLTAAAPLRTAAIVDRALAADVAAAVVCDPHGLGVPLHHADPDVPDGNGSVLGWFVDPDHGAATAPAHDEDGDPHYLVWWEHREDALYRGVQQVAGCTETTAPPPLFGHGGNLEAAFLRLADGVGAVDEDTPVLSVTPAPGDGVAGGDCAWPTVPACVADSVALQMSVAAPGEAAGTRHQSRYPIPYDQSRLR